MIDDDIHIHISPYPPFVVGFVDETNIDKYKSWGINKPGWWIFYPGCENPRGPCASIEACILNVKEEWKEEYEDATQRWCWG